MGVKTYFFLLLFTAVHSSSVIDQMKELRNLIKGTKLPGINNEGVNQLPKNTHQSKLEQNEENSAFPLPKEANVETTTTTTTEKYDVSSKSEEQNEGDKDTTPADSEDLWDRFRKQWNEISSFYAAEQLTKKDKLNCFSSPLSNMLKQSPV